MPPPPPRKGRGKLFLILGAAALALILAVVAVVALVGRGKGDAVAPYPAISTGAASSGPTTVSDPSTPPPPASAKPSDAVAGYLQALAAGNAAGALGYSAQPVRGPLLTNAVLAQSRKRAPMTAISVPAVDNQNAFSVPATYRLGRTKVSTSFDVVKQGDVWKLETAVVSVLASQYDKAVPLRVNGVKVSGQVDVLPGAYAMETGLRYVSYGSKDVVVVKSPRDFASFQPTPTITDAGKKLTLSRAKKDWKRCLSARSLAPKGCPFGISSGGHHIIKSTIRWRRTGPDPFRHAKAHRDTATTGFVRISFTVAVRASCSGFTGCTGDRSNRAAAVVTLTGKAHKVHWFF